MEQLLMERPPEFVDGELALVEAQRGAILGAVNTPHAEWYDRAEIEADCLAEYLKARLDGLAVLGQREHWRKICELGREYEGKLKL
jgi:hypothetical protein